MMRWLFIILLTCCVRNVSAQSPLSINEQGKYIYYRVDTLKSGPGTLASLQKFFKQNAKVINAAKLTGDSLITGTGKFVLSKSAGSLSHPAGAARFTFAVEKRGTRFRYWFTDFKVVPYTRDRYGNFVPGNTPFIELEIFSARSGQDKDDFIAAIAVQAKKFSEQFLKEMTSGPEEKKVIDTRKW